MRREVIVSQGDKEIHCRNCGMKIVERRFPETKCCGYKMVWVHVWNSHSLCHPSTYAEPSD